MINKNDDKGRKATEGNKDSISDRSNTQEIEGSKETISNLYYVIALESNGTNNDSTVKEDGGIGTIQNPIGFPTLINLGRSFKAVLTNLDEQERENNKLQYLKPLAIPHFKGGNQVVDLDKDDYDRV